MTDPNELAALKASLRGAIATNETLAALLVRIETLPADGDPSGDDLAALARLSAAHAIASAALRGLVDTMLERRGLQQPVSTASVSAGGSDADQ